MENLICFIGKHNKIVIGKQRTIDLVIKKDLVN